MLGKSLFLGIGQNSFPCSSIQEENEEVYVKLSYNTIRGPQVTSADVHAEQM